MGVGNLIRNAILGPLVIWATLLAIALGWHFLQSPPALSIQDFAASTPKEVKEALIKMRQPLIQEVIQLYKVQQCLTVGGRENICDGLNFCGEPLFFEKLKLGHFNSK